jgi:apoptosis-inducing factor 2
VTIVQGSSALLHSSYPDRFRNHVATSITSRGVDIVYNDYIDSFTPDYAPPEGSVLTRNGKSIKADLVIPTRGGRPNTAFLDDSGLPLNEHGQIAVEETFQVKGARAVFAVGDVTDIKEQKQAAKHEKHAHIAAENALAVANGAEPTKRYGGSMELIILTNGRVRVLSRFSQSLINDSAEGRCCVLQLLVGHCPR